MCASVCACVGCTNRDNIDQSPKKELCFKTQNMTIIPLDLHLYWISYTNDRDIKWQNTISLNIKYFMTYIENIVLLSVSIIRMVQDNQLITCG